MRTEQARPVRLADYRLPDWLVETVDLDVSLHPTATRVRAKLRLKPNPAAEAPAPLVLPACLIGPRSGYTLRITRR